MRAYSRETPDGRGGFPAFCADKRRAWLRCPAVRRTEPARRARRLGRPLALTADGSDHAQSQVRGHGVEVVVVMEQKMAARQAERPDDQVNGLADRHALVAQGPIVPGAEDRELFVEHSLDPELAQIGLEPRGVRLAPRALQHLRAG